MNDQTLETDWECLFEDPPIEKHQEEIKKPTSSGTVNPPSSEVDELCPLDFNEFMAALDRNGCRQGTVPPTPLSSSTSLSLSSKEEEGTTARQTRNKDIPDDVQEMINLIRAQKNPLVTTDREVEISLHPVYSQLRAEWVMDNDTDFSNVLQTIQPGSTPGSFCSKSIKLFQGKNVFNRNGFVMQNNPFQGRSSRKVPKHLTLEQYVYACFFKKDKLIKWIKDNPTVFLGFFDKDSIHFSHVSKNYEQIIFALEPYKTRGEQFYDLLTTALLSVKSVLQFESQSKPKSNNKKLYKSEYHQPTVAEFIRKGFLSWVPDTVKYLQNTGQQTSFFAVKDNSDAMLHSLLKLVELSDLECFFLSPSL